MDNIQFSRHRRLRQSEAMRALVRETTLPQKTLSTLYLLQLGKI